MAPRILIVDDEPDLVVILENLLRARGYDTLAAGDGVEAVELVQRERPDLVVLDVMLPEMNGYQVCRLLKGDPDTRAIPILMLTAKAHNKDVYWGLDAGAEVYLTKPFDNAELLAKVAALLRS